MQHVAQQFAALLTLSLILASVFEVPAVFAQQSYSTDFSANSSVNALGGTSSSTDFTAVQSVTQTAQGESTSTNYVLDSGYQYSDTFSPQSQNWRWYSDVNNETPAAALAAEDAAPSSIGPDPLKLRVTVAETAGIGESGVKLRLEYATASDFSDAAYVAEAGDCGTAGWCYATSTGGTDNAVITTALLSDAGACSGGVGDGCGTHNTSGTTTSSFTQQKSAATEYEFTLEKWSASPNTVYFFRLFDNVSSSTVPLASGASYPSLSTGGGTLSLAINGVPSATNVSGVTTNIDTTSTNVSFGALPIGSPVAGAQQFTVTTSATQGYSIFAFEQQALLGSGGSEIPPVSGTNLVPQSWSTGCGMSATGCYGYHTDASVLSGTTTGEQTRFAADDTYAQFGSAPAEVAYSAAPASGAVTDVLYRVLANDLQPAGSYSTSIVYIVVPVF